VILCIGHIDYTISPMAEGDPDIGVNLGSCDPLNQKITIDTNIPAPRQLEVLIHEIAHAGWHEYAQPDSLTEEQAVTFFGRVFAAIIQTNDLLPLLASLRGGGCLSSYCSG
jgi:hypothetical protein